MSEMSIPVILSAKRTAIGKYGSVFKETPPEMLAAEVIQAILREIPIPPETSMTFYWEMWWVQEAILPDYPLCKLIFP